MCFNGRLASVVVDGMSRLSRLRNKMISAFVMSHWCSAGGHAWVPISRCDSAGGWVPTGVERCENCGKERPSLCHYCDAGIAADTCVYRGHRCCRECFDKKDSVTSAFGYAHGDPRWTNEKK